VGFWAKLVEVLPDFLPVLLEGFLVSLQVASGSFALAMVLGLVLAVAAGSSLRAIRWAAIGYIELFRGTPALTQLFIIYFGLAEIGLGMPPMAAAIVGLGANGAAYLSQVYRAGIEAVERGQREAALTIGLRPAQAMRYVVLPQAFRVMVPAFCNQGIQLLKDTTLVSSVAAPEIMFRARNLVMETYLSMQVYLLVAVIYLAVGIPLGLASRRLERRLARAG
jgi:His/Glu/Gln/Arg/opine family amino acid ABC transporter permease subunit